jgi:hypothetical protein
MAAVTIVKILEKGWDGNRRRNRVVFTVASATTDSITPKQVGLHRIDAIRPTGRIGSWEGLTLVGASHASLNSTNDIIITYGSADADGALSAGNVEADFYGI